MSSLVKIIFFIFDICLLNLSMLSAFYFNSGFQLDHWADSIYLIIFSNISWLFLILVSQPYSVTKEWPVSKIIKSQIAFLVIHLLVTSALVVFLNRQYDISQIILFYFFFLILYFGYRLLFYYLRKFTIQKSDVTRFILIGRNDLAFEVRKFYLKNPAEKYQFVSYIEYEGTSFPIDKIQQICSTNNVQEIICCTPFEDKSIFKELIQFGLDSLIKVRLIFAFNNGLPSSIALQENDRLPGIDILAVKLDEPQNQILKRSFDIVFSILFFVFVLTWLIPIIAILIKIDSKGPVFFIQQRNGEGNRPFNCFKFRTMVVNNEADSKQATKNDSRITRMGKFLRKSSIDELPQFINVLKGEMSLIGPRPHPIKLNEKFQPLISNLLSRHYVKPGITGLAQCMGYRGETNTLADMENRVRLDRYYIENWTFWLDIKIVFLTVVSLIRGSDKAY